MPDWIEYSKDLRAAIDAGVLPEQKAVSIEGLVRVLDALDVKYIKLDEEGLTRQKYCVDIMENEVRTLSTAFDKGAAYTNLIITAGYASFFGIWSLMKDQLTSHDKKMAAILLCVSAFSFVMFEVYKSLMTSANLHNTAKNTGSLLGKNLAQQAAIVNQRRFRNEWYNIGFIHVWRVTSAISLITASAAIAYLFWGFLWGLL